MTFVRATQFLLSRGGGCEVAVKKKKNDLLHNDTYSYSIITFE